MTAIDVCVVGEINLDLILYGLPKNLELDRELLANELALTLGSSSAIFAHNLSALGTKVGFVSLVGKDGERDPLGRVAVQRLAEAGVDVSQVRPARSETQTGLTVALPVHQQRYILTYPGTMFEFEYSDIAMSYVRGAKHLHLSSYFLLRALRPRIPELFREAKAAGLSTSLDTNDDPEDKWEADLREVFAHLDILFVNEREAKKMTGLSDHTMAADALAERVPMVVMKRGALPAVCRAGKNEWSAAPPRVEVVDSVGAGDSFAAGFIHQHLRGAKPADSLAFANAAGAYSTTRAGGTEAFRDREALRDFLERQGWEQAKSSVDND